MAIDHHDDGTHGENAEECASKFGNVGECNDDALFGCDAQTTEDVAKPSGKTVDFGVREAAIASNDGNAITVAFAQARTKKPVSHVEVFGDLEGSQHGADGATNAGADARGMMARKRQGSAWSISEASLSTRSASSRSRVNSARSSSSVGK
jgi:hypothetical protein